MDECSISEMEGTDDRFEGKVPKDGIDTRYDYKHSRTAHTCENERSPSVNLPRLI